MHTRTLTWILFFVCLLALVLRVTAVTMDREARRRVLEQSTYQNLRDTIADRYVGEVKDEELFFGALQGMTGVLDRHSAFWTPEEYELEKTSTSGQFAGVGIEITFDETQGLVVVTPIADTPAFKAGILPHDIITHIDGDAVGAMTPTDASKRIRGLPGTYVKLTIQRNGAAEPLVFNIQRSIIKVQSVQEAQLLMAPSTAAARIPPDAPKIGYIQVSLFQEETVAELDRAMKELSKQGMRALILDLRQNPGGLLESAWRMCDLFIADGKVVVTKGRTPDGSQAIEEVYKAAKDGVWEDLPLAVLIDSRSASASEIVAGALRDHGRAVLVGEKSYGKGSVQTIIPVSIGEMGEGALKLTTAKYFTPSGECIDGTGIKPDFPVPFTTEQMRGLLIGRRDRRILHNTPPNGKPPDSATKVEAQPPDRLGEDQKDAEAEKPFYDLQLEKAVEVLTEHLRK